MTGYGLIGPQTDYDTVFDPKSEGATGQRPRSARYRYAYQLTDRIRCLLMMVGG